MAVCLRFPPRRLGVFVQAYLYTSPSLPSPLRQCFNENSPGLRTHRTAGTARHIFFPSHNFARFLFCLFSPSFRSRQSANEERLKKKKEKKRKKESWRKRMIYDRSAIAVSRKKRRCNILSRCCRFFSVSVMTILR